jgi:hypothetical protein
MEAKTTPHLHVRAAHQAHAPYAPPRAQVQEKAPTMIRWPTALSVWWSAAWRGALYGLLGGFLLGAVAGVIAAVLGVPEKAHLYGTIAGYIAALPASMLGLKQALSKHLASLAAAANANPA